MLSIDLGQSGARIRINDETIISNRGKLAGEEVIEALRAIFSSTKKLESKSATLSLTGLNGIDFDAAPFGKLCTEFFGATSIAIMDDGLAAFAGAIGGKDGVALAIGGGVVAVGGRNSNFSHTDGLGAVTGDEGGGYWLGSRGLARALATREGRDKQTDLFDFLLHEITQFDDLQIIDGVEAVRLSVHAGKKVLEAADLGIASALKIRNEGAFLLSQTIYAAWINASGNISESPTIVILGGLSKNQSYVSEIYKNLSKIIPQARFAKPLGDNLDGAEWIATHMKEDVPPMLRWHNQ